MPHGIQGLAIGAFGETGKGISDYFRLLANTATKMKGILQRREAPLTSRRARSGEGLAPCAKVLRF
jgi:hypothetical protein